MLLYCGDIAMVDNYAYLKSINKYIDTTTGIIFNVNSNGNIESEDKSNNLNEMSQEWWDSLSPYDLRIADIIYGYGEERFARRIAKAIVEYRKDSEIKTSAQLAEIVEKALPKRFVKFGRHPATKTFQALRIAVNDELEVLKKSLDNIHDVLSSGGRLAVITFHSLEDRIVKNKFRDWKKEGRGVLVNKKVILPDKEELQVNKRARSAKLRVYEKK